MFTKVDLRNGDFVEYRDGSIRLVVDDRLFGIYSSSALEYFTDQLLSNDRICSNMDIIKVYRGGHTFQTATTGTVVFDRNKDVIEEMTIEEVCRALGKNIKIVNNHEDK